tara:strand:+ start:457 stop:726 length:270 start_codon:yes stop_codon:yes gene_type:complete
MKQKKYFCEGCNYSTNIKSHWDKHILTKKHQNVFRCEICDLKLGSKSSYYRHKKECKGSLLISKINELTQKIKELEERVSQCEQQLSVY